MDQLRKRLEKRVEELLDEIRNLREQFDEYRKRHPANIGKKNDKPYEIKMEITYSKCVHYP